MIETGGLESTLPASQNVIVLPKVESKKLIADGYKEAEPLIPDRDERLGFRGTTLIDRWLLALWVELRGLEPRTSTLPVLRSPG